MKLSSLSFKTLAPLFVTAFIICLPLVALAQTPTFTSPGGSTFTSPGNETCAGGVCSIQNPLRVTSFCGLLELVLRAAIIIGMPVAVLFLTWVGFQFIIARGNPKAIGHAQKNLFYTVIGIGIFLGAWTIAQIIKSTLSALLPAGSFGSC